MVSVPEQAKQTTLTEVQEWTWVNRTIWTDRMLAALDNGVKGGKWFSAGQLPSSLKPGFSLYQ